MTIQQFDADVNHSEMLRQADAAAALATFVAAGGGAAAWKTYDAAVRTAEVNHFKRRLTAAVANNPSAAAELAYHLRTLGTG